MLLENSKVISTNVHNQLKYFLSTPFRTYNIHKDEKIISKMSRILFNRCTI